MENNKTLSGYVDMLKSQIMETGGFTKDDDDFLFQHLVLEESLLERLKELGCTPDKLKELLDVDFISIKKHGEVDFLHTSHISNLESIENQGLVYEENPDFICDLGIGLYVIDKNSFEAIDNLATYVTNHYDYNEEELVVVKGSYTGSYTECILGYKHEGYVVIKDKLDPSTLDVDVESIDDFLYNF